MTVGRKKVLQDQYVYERVTGVLPADRVLVQMLDIKGLPTQPLDYHFLMTNDEIPYFASFRTGRRLSEGETFVKA